MRVYDLTHTVSEDILVWPGTEKPRLSEGSTFEKDGFRETRLEIFSHVGTHMDAPAHMRRDRPQLDELPASAFCGSAWVLDARDCAPGVEIGPEAVEPVRGADFLLVCTAGPGIGTARSTSAATRCSPPRRWSAPSGWACAASAWTPWA